MSDLQWQISFKPHSFSTRGYATGTGYEQSYLKSTSLLLGTGLFATLENMLFKLKPVKKLSLKLSPSHSQPGAAEGSECNAIPSRTTEIKGRSDKTTHRDHRVHLWTIIPCSSGVLLLQHRSSQPFLLAPVLVPIPPSGLSSSNLPGLWADESASRLQRGWEGYPRTRSCF